MKLLANENIPLRSSQYVEEKGYDRVHIGIITPSITDEEVIGVAVDQLGASLYTDAPPDQSNPAV